MSGGWEDRTASYIKIVNAVYLAIRVHYAGFRVGAHASSPKMMGGICIWQLLYISQILFNMTHLVVSEVFVQ